MKPLFIPLKAEHYLAFENGTKTNMEEYRPYGARWNSRTCAIGREVILSYGYGTQRRMIGIIIGFRRDALPTQSDAWRGCYGDKGGDAACIKIGELRPLISKNNHNEGIAP